MKQIFTLLILSINGFAVAQQQYVISFEHVALSRGNSTNGYEMALLQEEQPVTLMGQPNSSSGLGPTFTYYGTMLVIDQMDTQPNGSIHAVVRREDGKDFFGYTPTLSAVLTPLRQATFKE